MATIAQMRSGLKTALATVSGLRASDYVVGAPNPPVAMVSSPSISYDETFGAKHTYTFTVVLVASRATDDRGQAKLDTFLEPSSITAAIHADRTLAGLVDDTRVSTVRPGIAEWAGTDYYQAEFAVEVYG